MPNLDELIKSFNAHWRSQLTAFELILARNFLEMNGLELEFKDTGQRGEFSFVVQVAMTAPTTNGKTSQLAVPNRAKSVFESDVPTHAEGQPANAQLSHADIVKHYNLSTDNATVLLETTPPTPLVEETTPLRQRRPENLPEWRSVIEYEDVDWASLGYVNRHTYHRLTNPLIKALGHLDTVRYSEDKNESDKSLDSAQQHLEIMITSMKAWATLTRWKNSGEISLDKLPLLPDEFPNWFTHYIQQKTTLELKHSLPLHVNHDAFFEGILLLVEISQYVGTPRMVQFRNAKNDKGVWVQVVFRPPHRRFYKSKLDVLDSFIRTNPMGEELAMQFAVADDLFKLHGTHFTLQENTKTGEQAFAILMPLAGERVPMLAGALVVSDESPLS